MTSETSALPERKNGLTTVLNTVIAPREAFESLRDGPTWGWAYVIVMALSVVGWFIALPVNDHIAVVMTQNMIAHNVLGMGSLTDEQKARALERAAHPAVLNRVFGLAILAIVPFLVVFIETLFLLAGNAIGRGKSTFKQLWAAAMNINVVTFGLFTLAISIVAVLRGPASFSTSAEYYRDIPTLALLVPQGSPGMVAFFATIQPFSLWGLFLMATALIVIGNASRAVSWATAIVNLLFYGMLSAAIANAFKF
ncbi:MAG: hypothetical protein JOZ38_03935 [Candidatus Eremiobacteraeota bacterium]|nr:hypothetical protein [Candidatus Eremiobacteraeota bacterium]